MCIYSELLSLFRLRTSALQFVFSLNVTFLCHLVSGATGDTFFFLFFVFCFFVFELARAPEHAGLIHMLSRALSFPTFIYLFIYFYLFIYLSEYGFATYVTDVTFQKTCRNMQVTRRV